MNYNAYWTLWLIAVLITFLGVEIFALTTGGLTLSSYVWSHLHIVKRETIGQWTATDLLIFCAYISVFVIWLPWHFFFRKFT